MQTMNRRKSLLLTSFTLRSHPRLKGWSKPQMEVYEVQTIRQNRPAQFNNKPVRIVGIQQNTVILSAAPAALNEKEEVRQYPLNQPVRQGTMPDFMMPVVSTILPVGRRSRSGTGTV